MSHEGQLKHSTSSHRAIHGATKVRGSFASACAPKPSTRLNVVSDWVRYCARCVWEWSYTEVVVEQRTAACERRLGEPWPRLIDKWLTRGSAAGTAAGRERQSPQSLFVTILHAAPLTVCIVPRRCQKHFFSLHFLYPQPRSSFPYSPTIFPIFHRFFHRLI